MTARTRCIVLVLVIFAIACLCEIARAVTFWPLIVLAGTTFLGLCIEGEE